MYTGRMCTGGMSQEELYLEWLYSGVIGGDSARDVFVDVCIRLWCTFARCWPRRLPGSDGSHRGRVSQTSGSRFLTKFCRSAQPPRPLKLENCQGSELGEAAYVLDAVYNPTRPPPIGAPHCGY